MSTDSLLTSLPGVSSQDGKHLYTYAREGRYLLVWWHPQVLSPVACKSCSGGIQEPIQLLLDIHDSGCDVVGLTYEPPERVARYLNDIGLEYPILSVDEIAARAHGVAKVSGESWPSIPHRVAFLVDSEGQIINRYDVNDATVFLRTVLADVKAGPPVSQWTPVKRSSFFSRLLGR